MKPGEAAGLFDEAVRNPAHRSDAMGALFAGLAAAAQQAADARQRLREQERLERFNRPEAVAARRDRSVKGRETRRRRAAEEAVRDAWDVRPVRTGLACGEMNHNSVGSEVFCELDQDHDEDHDAGDGVTWERED